MTKKKAKRLPKIKRIPINGGSICRHCKIQTQRYEHPAGWKPKTSSFYFYWDICGSCRRIYVYPEAWASTYEVYGDII